MNIFKSLILIAVMLITSTAFSINHRARIATGLAMVVVQEMSGVDVDTDGGPHPDAKKCPCKGSGTIRNGDGISSSCPYHGSGSVGDSPKNSQISGQNGADKPIIEGEENVSSEMPPVESDEVPLPKEALEPTFGAEIPPSNEFIDAHEKEVNDWNPSNTKSKGVIREKTKNGTSTIIKKINIKTSLPNKSKALVGDIVVNELFIDDDTINNSMTLGKNVADYEYVIYCFSATWCGPCRQMWRETWSNGEVQDLLEDKKVNFYKLMQDNPEHAKYFRFYRIGPIPAVIIVKRSNLNEVIDRSVGYQSKRQVISRINRVTQ